MKVEKNNRNNNNNNLKKQIGKQIFTMMMVFIVTCTICISFTPFVTARSNDYATLEITMLNQDPDPAKQGEYLDLRWKVVKIGNEKIDDITFNLELEYPFFLDKSESAEKKIGSWRGYSDDEEYYILHYKIRVDEEALEDDYDIKLKISHKIYDTEREYLTEPFKIKVGDKTKPEFVLGTLVTSPIKLLADTDENQLKVTLENIGDEDAENVRMDLELSKNFSATYGYSTRANLGTIDAGSSKIGTFYVDLDETITQGEYEGTISIHYKEANDDDNEYKIVKLPLSIPVNGKPMFSIKDVKTIPEKIREGNDVKLLITVKNTGTKEAESVSIRAFKESSQPFEFEEKSDFIGKLKPGETGEAVIKFKVEEEANVKTYLLDLEVRSIYNNEVLTENEIIPIKVQNGEEKSFFPDFSLVGLLIILIIVIGGLGVYHFMKKKNK